MQNYLVGKEVNAYSTLYNNTNMPPWGKQHGTYTESQAFYVAENSAVNF